MPATQHDLLVWVAGTGADTIFDTTLESVAALSGLASVAEETMCWSYHNHLDLTGFVDGTENPGLGEAATTAVIGDGPGLGGSVLLLQRWPHDYEAWTSLPVSKQEAVMGRTKAGNEELDPQVPDSHVARTDQDEVGKILRRNMAYGNVTRHGTMFVGLCAEQSVLHVMLERMAGVGGPRDALTRFTSAETGAYYFLPSLADLLTLTGSEAS